jgi:probable rRNA maturation factor
VNIEYIYEINGFKLEDELKCRGCLRKIAEKENKDIGNLKFIFVSEESIVDINREYLKHNYQTDIITFDNSFLNRISGDIFISIPTVQRNSLLYSAGIVENELNRVIIHGILHLMGYNDKSENEIIIMRKKENEYLLYFD